MLCALYELLFNAIRPSPANAGLALFGAAWFGLHPAIAETVNYIIQRGDLYRTRAAWPRSISMCVPARRRTGVYLLPLVFALLSKPPAAVFPVLLFAYVYFFESSRKPL